MESSYRHVLYGQLENLESTHPRLFALGPSDEHYPRSMASLRTCPDIYEGFPCFFYLCRGDRIAASIAALPDTGTIEGQTYPWAWMGALYTSVDSRGRGIGYRLIANVVRTMDEYGITMGGSFANAISIRIGAALGFTLVGKAPRLLLLKSARPFLSPHLTNRFLLSVVDFPYRTVVSGLNLLSRVGNHRVSGLEVRSLDDLKEAVDRHGAAAHRRDYACHFNESWDKFLWKLSYCKGAEVFQIAERSSGTMMARFVTKSRTVSGAFAEKYTGFRLMTLMDFMVYGETDAGYDALADAIAVRFWESDADVLESVAASPALNARLKRKFMVHGGKGVDLIHRPPSGVTLPAAANVVTNWHFTHFSADAFSFA